MTLSPGAKAALGLWAAALTWDAFCPEGQTISQAIERGLNSKRTEIPVTLAIMVTAAHLLRAVDARYDLYAIGFRLAGRVVKRNAWQPR
jgi:hypothetical protein